MGITNSNVIQINTDSVKIDSIEVSNLMSVSIIDPTGKNFKIIPLNSQDKLIVSEPFKSADWQWDVIPLNHGKLLLNLTIEILVKYDNEERSSSIPVFYKRIVVHAPPLYENKFLIYAILIGILFSCIWWLIRHYRRRHMVLPDNHISYIKNLIKSGEIEQIFEYLEANSLNLSRYTVNILTSHQSEWATTKNNFYIGIISSDDMNRIRNRIIDSLLQIINKMENNSTERNK